jgi:glutamyl-tRNA reductase
MTTTAGFSGPRLGRLGESAASSLIAALHERAEDIRLKELRRAENGFEALCPDDRRRLEILTQDIVDALLDEPTARLQAGTAQDPDHLESARFLFGLEP